mmetsp:Transcript_35591/g.72533  ORF Transcript_35591/g.72533 Transcript_35591/m.72533 type:complete len:107 (-) Transcript_35591:227-547(-)|eukprot:CAMPEP_0171637124 /NCGR_PEP_ID=MMETSP0990-20121206/27945_1 /TAXON_ID=483369 /ORGANISM="non described non described, Strain CCMP2098" /LENGTH=106 /DNA_ID=CAMNT_0012209639 /DNA_START=56 /DNA_END=376 /DNA_ORIENTATION=-
MPLWGGKKGKDSKELLKLEIISSQADLAAAVHEHEKYSAETSARFQVAAAESRELRAEHAGLKARAAAVADERDRARAEVTTAARAKVKAEAKVQQSPSVENSKSS